MDSVVLSVVLTVIVLFSVILYTGNTETLNLYIETTTGYWIYPFDSNLNITVNGPVGETDIRISDGKASITASGCRDKLCVHTGELSRHGEWAACLPNRVIIRVKGSSDGEIDALSY